MTTVWTYTIVDRDLASDDLDAAIEMHQTYVAFPDRETAKREALVEWASQQAEDDVVLDPASVRWDDTSDRESVGYLIGWTQNDPYLSVWSIVLE